VAQLESGLTLGLRIEVGDWTVSKNPDGTLKVVQAEQGTPEPRGQIRDEDIPF
jgi:hypothetical protein